MNPAYQAFTDGVQYLQPEICLTVAIIAAALWNLFFPKAKEMTWVWTGGGLIGALWLLLSKGLPNNSPHGAILFNGVFTQDALTVAFGALVLIVGFIVFLMTIGYEHHLGRNRGEFYAILLTAILSVMILAGTTDLILLFVALETLSICCILLSAFNKRDAKSSEAALKYLLSTAATTATLMYGLSFVYGLSASTSYSVIAEKMSSLAGGQPSLLQIFIPVLILSAIGFKLSTAPFHMWTPDVYEGAPTPVTAFLSIGSKAGGFVIALRLLSDVFARTYGDWVLLLTIVAVLSMVMGNLIALAQLSFKRLLAYSSIAQVGYILIGLIAGSASGYSALVFYLLIYGAMNLGAFAGAILFENETGSDRIDDYAGLIRKRPYLTLGITICLLNLAGLPFPPAGFFAKVFVFGSGLSTPIMMGNTNIGWLLVAAAILTSIPSIYYYTRVAIKMIVEEPSERVLALQADRPFFDSPQTMTILALVLCVVFICSAGTFATEPLMKLSRMAVESVTPMNQSTNPISYVPNLFE